MSCVEKAVVEAGGQLVRRSTAFGDELEQKLNLRVARLGDVAPGFSTRHCTELASDQALNESDWLNPKPPPILAELASMSTAQTVFVPVIASVVECNASDKPWVWGRPAYENDRGDVDCIERELTLIGYLFDQRGTVIWKSVQRHELTEAPNTATLANELMMLAPIERAAPLRADSDQSLQQRNPVE